MARTHHSITLGTLGILLFGGAISQLTYAQTRYPANIPGFRGTPEARAQWFQRYPDSSPEPRTGHAMACNPTTSHVVLFGGRRWGSQSRLGDTWEYDGEEWIQRSPAVSPGRRDGHSMARTATGVLLFGGTRDGRESLADVWEWDGSQWTPRAEGPSAREGAAMAYDSGRNRVVLFGGARLTDTWEWDGVSWTQKNPAVTPGPIFFHGGAMAYDSIRQKIVLLSNGTWEWDGLDWRQRFPPQSPEPRGQPMAFHERMGKTILVSTVHPFVDPDTWEWDGSNWRKNIFAPTHRHEEDPAVAYDSRRGRLVMFGTNANDGVGVGETWEYFDPSRGRGRGIGPPRGRGRGLGGRRDIPTSRLRQNRD